MAWLAPSPDEVRRLTKAKKMNRCINLCWYDETGTIRKRSTGTKLYPDARKILVDFEKQLEEQKKAGLERTLFREAAGEFIKAKHITDGTTKRYGSLSEAFLSYAGQDIMAHDITLDLIGGFRSWAKENVVVITRSGERKEKKRYSDKTLNMILGFLGAVLKYSYERGYVQKDIASKIEAIPQRKVQQKAIRGFTDDELNAILSSKILGPNIRMCFLGLLHLGVRRGELAMITWDKVDLKGRNIRVFAKKTNKLRTVPISDYLLPHLEKAYDERGSRNHVFSRESGDVADKHLYRTLMRVCEDAGIGTTGITVHSFRHTFIQRHLQAGVNFKTIMSWSGHSDIKTFMIYLDQYQPHPEDINKAKFTFIEDIVPVV